MTDFQIPDGIEPVVGWRYWRLDDDGILQSLHHKMPWPPKERVTATCRVNESFRSLSPTMRPPPHIRAHTPPFEDCKCGIYASVSLDDLRKATGAPRERLIVGELHLWGDLVPGERGYRGQFAYPKTLYVVLEGQDDIGADTDEVRRGLSERYGVPVNTMAASDCAPWGFFPRRAGSVHVAISMSITQFGRTMAQAAQQMQAFSDSLKKIDDVINEGTVKVRTSPPLPARRNWTLLNKTPKRLLYQSRDSRHWRQRSP